IRAYLESLSRRHFQSSSLARKLSAIRQLYRFLYIEGRRKDDPAAVLQGPKRGRALPKIMSIADVDALLSAARLQADDESQSPLARLRAACFLCVVEFLYERGLRVGELVAFPASAAQRDQEMLIIRGKGDRERMVPLNPRAKSAMKDFIALRGEARSDASKW